MRKGSRAMKKLIFLGIGSALIFTMGGVGPAQADGGIHWSSKGAADSTYRIADAGATRCAGCHRAHTAKASMLLKEAQPALCYSCHGTAANGSSTDVQNGKNDGNGAALRGGGFDFALIGASEAMKTMGPALVPDPITGIMPPSYKQLHSTEVPKGASEATTSKHQIDGVTPGTMWGNGAVSAGINPGQANVKLECGSCHDPHGNGNYRILKPVPNDAGATVVEVNIPDAVGTAREYTTTDYWKVTDRTVPVVKGGAAPAVGVTDGYIANASQWCSTCHTRYLAGSESYKTDSGDAVFMYRHRSDRVDKAGVERPNCIQCHVSHGSNAVVADNVSGTSMLNPGDTPAAAGDSKLLRIDQRGVCVACHNV